MLTILANQARTVLNPSDDYHRREPNLSTGATVALVVGGVILVPIVIWGVIAALAVNAVSGASQDFNNNLPSY